MATDHALVAVAKQSIAVLLSPTSTNEDRSRAHEVLEEVKRSAEELKHVGFELALCSDLQLQFGGLQLIEHGICTHWTTEYCSSLVPKICQYWKEVLQCDGQPKLILVQLSRVLAELSKRLWPQCWKSFTDDVLSSLQTGKSQLLVGLLTLQGLGDDLLGPEQKVKDKERKKQLMAALRADIIRFSDFFRNILQNVSDMEVLKTTLEALTTYIGWMPMGAVFSGESGREITDCLLKVLYIAPLRTAGADCLLILASRKDSYAHAKEMRTKTIDWFFSNFPVLLEVISTSRRAVEGSMDSMDVEEEYQFLKLMSLVTMEMGTTLLLLYWKSQGVTAIPPNFTNYLELMLFWLSFDSQIVSTDACDFWKVILDGYCEVEAVVQSIPFILDIFHKTLSKVDSKFSRYDFTDTVESTSYSSVCKNSHVNLLRQLMMKVDPVACKDHLFLWTKRLVSASDLTQVDSISSELGPSHPTVLEWNAFLSFLETWTKCLKLLPVQGPQGIADGLAVLKDLLKCESNNHGWVMWCVLKSWCVLHSFAIHDPSIMEDILFKLARYIVYCPVGEQMHKFSKSTLHVRRTALSGLSKLCGSFPKELSKQGLTEMLLKYYTDLLSEDKIRLGEKPGFVESIAFLSHCIPDMGKWQEVLQNILGRERAVVDLVQKHSAHTNTEYFLKYLHFDKEPTDPLYNEGRLKRAQLLASVGCYTAVLKAFAQVAKMLRNDTEVSPLLLERQGILFKSIAADLTVLILRFIKCLYEIWSPVAVPHLSSSLKSLSEKYHSFEIETIMGSAVLHPELKETGEEVDFVRLWLSNLYENCVMFVENVMCSCPEFYATPSAPRHVAEFVFVESMDPLRQKIALRHVFLGGVNACSPCHYGNLIPFIVRSFNLTLEVLNQRWNRIALTRAQSSTGENSDSTGAEVFYYHLTVFLGREYLKCLDAALLRMTDPSEHLVASNSVEMVDAMEGQPLDAGAQMNNLGLGGVILSELACFLWEQGYVNTIIQWTFGPLVWLDSQHVVRAAKLAAGVYSKLLTSGVLDANLSCSLFHQVLQSINIYSEEVAKTTVNLGFYIYSTNLSCEPVRQLLLQANFAKPSELQNVDAFITKGTLKQARDLFKKIASRIQEVPLSERYKKEAFIPKLPEEKQKKRRSVPSTAQSTAFESNISEEEDILGLASLFGE